MKIVKNTLIVVGVLVILGIVGIFGLVALLSPAVEEVDRAVADIEQDAAGSPHVTLDAFNQVENGMTYDEVVQVFGGEEGTLSSETEIEGAAKSEIYDWQGADFAFVSIIFEDGKVMSKSQAGLE